MRVDINNDWEQQYLDLIDVGEKLTEAEIAELCDVAFHTEEGENRRWSRAVTSYVKLKGRIFAIDWEEGLTECQENEYFNQPYEVEEHSYEKTITVTEFVRKKE